MIRNLIASAGGRGFMFAIFAFLLTAGFTLFNGMAWAEWLDYNKWIGAAFMGAKALEEGAARLKGGK